MSEHLDAYKEGWSTGNAEMILRAVATGVFVNSSATA